MPRRHLPSLVLGLLLAACSGPAVTCPNDLPPACPSPAPSYAAQVAPLLAARCQSCHRDGGTAPGRTFDSYAEVHAQRTAVLTQTYACRMPPLDGGTPLDAPERATLLGWLVCGAPDN